MNVLARDGFDHEVSLRKVTQLWGVKRDFSEELRDLDEDEGEPAVWILYLLAPKWVKMRPTDAIYTLVPHARRGKLSPAGESVLQTVGLSQASTTTGPSLSLDAGPSRLTDQGERVEEPRGKVAVSILADALGQDRRLNR